MMPRMDLRTQLKCDRGEWGYRYRLVRGGGPSGSVSVVRSALRRFGRRSIGRQHRAEMCTTAHKV